MYWLIVWCSMSDSVLAAKKKALSKRGLLSDIGFVFCLTFSTESSSETQDHESTVSVHIVSFFYCGIFLSCMCECMSAFK